jgi:hypothetical protein
LTDGSFVTDAERGDVLRLDGTGYVEVADSADINLSSHGQRTIALSFKADDIIGRQVLYEEGGGSRGLIVYIENGQLTVGGWNRVSSESDWRGTWLSTSVTAGQWHHVALTLNGGGTVTADALKGYLDGQLFGSGTGSQLWSRSGDIGIGGNNDSTVFADEVTSTASSLFTGMLDDVRIYNRTLTDEEIALLAGM